jgi:hypothetical protein
MVHIMKSAKQERVVSSSNAKGVPSRAVVGFDVFVDGKIKKK